MLILRPTLKPILIAIITPYISILYSSNLKLFLLPLSRNLYLSMLRVLSYTSIVASIEYSPY